MKKKSIAIFMTFCLLLTGCQGNVNKTEQKEETRLSHSRNLSFWLSNSKLKFG